MDKPDLTSYLAAVERARTSPEAFQFFRSWSAICKVTDTNTVDQGLQCEQEIMISHRILLPWLDMFRHIDELGMPMLYRFPHVGLFNPTTLRHIVTMIRIQKWFGDPIHCVWEVGGSYGLLASLLTMTGYIQHYVMFEQKPVVGLSYEFLRTFGLSHVFSSCDPGTLPETFTKPDITISCYALSELDRDEQDWYIDNVLIHARAGFLVMNSCKNGYPRLEMIQRLENKLGIKVHCEREIPLTHKDNYTLLWKHGGTDGQ